MFESINAVGFFENLWGLFDIGGRMKQNAFCPMLVFGNGQINFRYLFLVLKLFGLANSKRHPGNWCIFSKIFENNLIYGLIKSVFNR